MSDGDDGPRDDADPAGPPRPSAVPKWPRVVGMLSGFGTVAAVGLGLAADARLTFQLSAYMCLAAFGALGAWTAVAAALAFDRGRASHRWPRTDGVVVASSVLEQTAPNSSRFPSSGGFVYSPVVEYRYTVDGREYRGHQVRFGGVPAGSHGEAQRVVEAYPPGAAVAVHHHSRRPDLAVLEPGGSPRLVRQMLVGLFVIVVTALMIFAASEQFARQRAARGQALRVAPPPRIVADLFDRRAAA